MSHMSSTMLTNFLGEKKFFRYAYRKKNLVRYIIMVLFLGINFMYMYV